MLTMKKKMNHGQSSNVNIAKSDDHPSITEEFIVGITGKT